MRIHLRRARHSLLALCLLLAACNPADRSPTPTTPTTEPAPSPTPLAAADLLLVALEQRHNGAYDAAAQTLHELLVAHPGAPEARTATFYLAESYAQRGRWTSAAEAFRALIDQNADDEWHARSLFWLGRAHESAGAHVEAVAIYQQYRALNTPLAPYALLREAAQLGALGRNADAAAAYEAAAASDIARGERAGAYEKAIALRRADGNDTQALADYRELLAFAESPTYRAPLLEAGAALAAALGDEKQARTWRQALVADAPAMPQALAAVAALAADPEGALDPAQAALIYEFHGQPAAALPYYDAAIAAASGEAALELQRKRALAQRNDDPAGAQIALDSIVAAAPDSAVGRQARLDSIQTTGQTGDTAGALNGYTQFASSYPDDPLAPEALSRAAILRERLGDPEGAMQERWALGQRYPASAQGLEALYAAGWHFYTTSRMPEAQAAWDLQSANSNGSTAAQAAFWAAHAATASGKTDVANDLYNRAIAKSPWSYYATRAAEILGHQPAQATALGAPVPAEQWRDAETWLQGWSNVAVPGDVGAYPADVGAQGHVLLARELGALALLPEAIGEWNTARDEWHDDPAKLYMVARLANASDVPYIALKAAEDVAALAPDTAPAPPAALVRLIFPAPYPALVAQQAAEHGVDPRALLAMMRQESLFNPGATSWVGARGLAQVMPSTAQGIAQNLQVPNFQEGDLYRPAVSIQFGAYYLGAQQRAMNGSLQGALAAYNGGPGNAQRWADGDTVADPDLFAERIDYAETRDYVKRVYGYYGVYQQLYAAKP